MGNITEEVAKRLRHVRVELKKMQSEIADLVGLTQSQWAKIERNERKLDIETLIKLKQEFKNISIDYILFGKGGFWVSNDSDASLDNETMNKLVNYINYLGQELKESQLDVQTFERALKDKGIDIDELLEGGGEAAAEAS